MLDKLKSEVRDKITIRETPTHESTRVVYDNDTKEIITVFESEGATLTRNQLFAGADVEEVFNECRRLKLNASKEVLDEVEKLISDEEKAPQDKREAARDRNEAIREYVREARKAEPVKPVEPIRGRE